MANFMGPMAPPQAAPPQPAQLDIRTNPSQRAQFKSFMQGMQVQPTTAPIAPMLPAPTPSPMDQVDIFAPVPMASGGVVGGLQDLGKMSGQMVEALNTVVYGGEPGGGGMGGGIAPVSGSMLGGPMSSGGGFGGGQMPPPLPPMDYTLEPQPLMPPTQYQTQPLLPPAEVQPMPSQLPNRLSLNEMSALGMPTPSYMPMDPDGDGMDQQGRPMEAQLTDQQLDALKTQFTGLRSSVANQGGPFGSGSMGSPLARLGGLGSFGSVFGYEDGGAVGMRNGGGVRMAGGTTNLRDTSRPSGPREDRDERAVIAARGEDPGEEAGIDRGFPNEVMRELERSKVKSIIPAEEAAAAAAAMDAAAANFVPGQVTTRERPLSETPSIEEIIARNERTTQGFRDLLSSMGDIDESAGDFAGVSPVAAAVTPVVDPERDLLFGEPRFELPSGTDPIDNFDMLTLGVTPYTAAVPSLPVPPPSDRLLQGPPQFIEETRNAARTVSPLINKGLEAVSGNLDYPGTVFDRPTSGLVVQGTTMSPLQAADAQAFALAEPFMGMGAGDFNFGTGTTAPVSDFLARNPQPRETDPISPLGTLMAGDVVYNRGKGNERTVNRLRDLENRMGVKRAFGEGEGLSGLAEPILSKIASATGGAMATKIFDNVVNQNKQPIIAADTNQIVGYADDGPFGRVYTGQPDYNPFGVDGQSFTVDPQTGALIVQRKSYMDNVGRPTSDDPVLTTPADPAQPPATPPPLMITPPSNPLSPAPPPDVVVPSPRGPVNIGTPVLGSPISVPNIAPVQGAGLPQSFLDLLASFNRPAPRAMQDGGAVLDQAAGNFLEALKVA